MPYALRKQEKNSTFCGCKEFSDVVEGIGDFIQYWGFKKIHGLIWSHIFLSQEPIDATTLVKRLKVSKALVSLAIKDLLQYQVIQLAGKGLKRTVYFESNPEVIKVIAQVLRSREQVMLKKLRSRINDFQQTQIEFQKGVDAQKMDALCEMVNTADDFLEILISQELDVRGAN